MTVATLPRPATSHDTVALRRTPYILVVDDEPDIRNLVQEILQDEGYEVGIAENGLTARSAYRKRKPDLVLLDIWMPDLDGITLLKEWSDDGNLPMPVIMMSGHGTVETAVEATRLGAFDFIEKPLSLAKLLLTVTHALEADRLRLENQDLRRHTLAVPEPIGRSPAMQRLREQVKRIAEHDTWVLLTGESGSGMNVVAHYLHQCSNQRERPFIEVNIASLTPGQILSELFGSEGNGHIHHGLLEQAQGGSVFLHDLADMDSTTQAKLLAALENKGYQRIGGSATVHLNTRIIAASHHDLEALIAAGKFRTDLYYLLNVVPIAIPPLREHREDVPELLNYYVSYFVDKEQLPFRKFAMAAQNRLRNYIWPGNIRELMNLVQRLLIISAGNEITLEEVDQALGEGGALRGSAHQFGFDQPLREAREQFERAYLEYQLKRNNGNVGKVAQIAGLERTHLYRKLRSLGLDPKNLLPDE